MTDRQSGMLLGLAMVLERSTNHLHSGSMAIPNRMGPFVWVSRAAGRTSRRGIPCMNNLAQGKAQVPDPGLMGLKLGSWGKDKADKVKVHHLTELGMRHRPPRLSRMRMMFLLGLRRCPNQAGAPGLAYH